MCLTEVKDVADIVLGRLARVHIKHAFNVEESTLHSHPKALQVVVCRAVESVSEKMHLLAARDQKLLQGNAADLKAALGLRKAHFHIMQFGGCDPLSRKGENGLNNDGNSAVLYHASRLCYTSE